MAYRDEQSVLQQLKPTQIAEYFYPGTLVDKAG